MAAIENSSIRYTQQRSGAFMGRMAQAMLLVAFLAVMALSAGMTQQAWAAWDLAAGSGDAAGVSAGAVDLRTQSDYTYLDADEKIYVSDLTAGRPSYDAATKTITLPGVSAKSLTINLEGDSLTLVLSGDSKLETVFSESNITVKGTGTLALSDSLNTFNDSALTMTQGTIKGEVSVGKLAMKGGTISGSGTGAKIYAHRGMTVTGGTISLASPASTSAISITDGDFTMSGGSVTVTGAKYDAISVSKYSGNSSKNIGKATITGGALSLSVTTPKSGWAIYAGAISNKLGCIKSITGRLTYGAQFKVKKNLYTVMSSSPYVQLKKYNGTAKKVKINTVTYGGYAYEVESIGSNAFNTATGKKVTSITVNSYLTQIGKQAFANTKALKTLTFKYTGWMKRVYDSKYNLKSLKVNTDCSVAKKAFAKAGKGGGKYLTVKLGKSGVWKKEAAKYKKFLKSKGLSGKAKLKTY